FESPPATDTLPWDPDRTIPASLEFRPDEIPTAAPSISISAVPGPGPNKFDVHRSVLVGADPAPRNSEWFGWWYRTSRPGRIWYIAWTWFSPKTQCSVFILFNVYGNVNFPSNAFFDFYPSIPRIPKISPP